MLSFDDAGRTYRIGELAKELDRSTLTIKKWEAKGLIPSARRDSRGWRYYTEDDVNEIKNVLEEHGYFVKSSVLTAHLTGSLIKKTWLAAISHR